MTPRDRTPQAAGRTHAVALLICAGCVMACRSTPPGAEVFAAPRHLVIVTIDTLRADRLGVYGSTTVKTPHLDRLAREGALAEQAAVHVPLTRPSHVSLFTGLYPAESGIRDNVSPSLAANVPVLAEILQQQGFRTAGFVSSVVLSRQSGLHRGFAHYSDRFEVGEDDARFLNTIQKRGDETMAEATAWLATGGGDRRFAWIHLYDPHDPYEPPEPYASTYAGRPYDGEVAWSDELVGRLESALVANGLRDDTLLIVTSDHGEGLEEHREAVHGYFVYETTIRVPLLVRGRGVVPGTRIGAVARTVDVLPTTLELLGLAGATPKTSGRSLATALRGEPIDEEPTFAESLTPLVHFGWSDLRAVRDGRWKYILAPRPELYDLVEDPGERRNLIDREPQRARAYRSGIEQRLREEQALLARAPAATAAIPPDLLEKLGALGYVSTAGGAAPKASGADPKDKIEEYQAVNTLMREGLVALREARFADSLGRFQALFGRGNDSFEAHYYAARALMGLERWTAAATQYEGAIEKLPAYTAAYVGLAEAHLGAGDLARAREAVRRGLTVAPDDPRLIERDGDIARRAGDAGAAVQAFRRVASLAPNDALIRIKLGELYRDVGRTGDAMTVMREAVKLDPTVASYWNALGMVAGGSGDLGGAEAAFREASTRDTSNAQYAYNLGLALARQQKRDEARAAFERALTIDPRFAPAREQLAALK
jgi:arylsulfatase A-like enzyme/Tfp pilus assembly protein PilF